MNYTAEQLDALPRDRDDASNALEQLIVIGLNETAPTLSHGVRQQIVHGASRRLGTMRWCLQRIFELFPPSQARPLPREVLSDVQVYLQAFIVNVSGVLDNWAWAFVLRHGLVDIETVNVGLFRPQTQRFLPAPFRDYLRSTLKNWHGEYLKDGRDSLAHQIPQYIPPALWTTEEATRYRELESEESECLAKHDFDRLEAIRVEQDNLGRAAPMFIGAFVTGGKKRHPVMLHPQLIVDCRTINEIGRRFYDTWHECRAPAADDNRRPRAAS
jgi:hypothetical protein